MSSLNKLNRCTRSTEESAGATQLPDSSVVLDLTELAEKYAQLVPFRMRVVNGFMATNTKDPSFVVDEIYSVHLVKETKVVKINSTDGEYSIPINSLAKFGLIHDKKNEWWTVYESVDDLLSAKLLPQVVAVQNDYTSHDKTISLKKNEVLAIKDISRSRIERSKAEVLKAFSFLSQKEIVFPKELKVRFMTDPHYTQLYLTDMVDHIAMPCLARFFPTSNSSLCMLTSMDITLQSQETQRSVIVSLFRDNPTSKKCKVINFIDILTSININVSIVETNNTDGIYQGIMEKSRDLLQDYNPAMIHACVDRETDAAYMTQAQLLAEVRREKEIKTLTKLAPQHYQSLLFSEAQEKPDTTCAARSSSIQSKSMNEMSMNETDLRTSVNIALWRETGPIYLPPKMKPVSLPPQIKPAPLVHKKKEPLPPPPVLSKHKKKEPLPPPPVFSKQKGSIDGKTIYEDVLQYNTLSVTNAERNTPTHEQQQLRILAKQIEEMQKSMATIVKQMDKVLQNQSDFEVELNTLRATCEISNGHAREGPTVHIGMSSAQVLGVLDAIGLPQYKEAFAQKFIDGELFAMLDDEILANELAVASKIHRIRILKLTK